MKCKITLGNTINSVWHFIVKIPFFFCIEKLVIDFVESMSLMIAISKKEKSGAKIELKEKVSHNGLKHVSRMRKYLNG